MISIVRHSRIGFGADLPSNKRSDFVLNRHDGRAVPPVDLYVLAALRELIPERWGKGDSPTEEIALYIACCKKLTSSLLVAGTNKFLRGKGTFTPRDIADVLAQINPLWCVAAVPNLAMYLAAKTFGIAGPMNQLTLEPWSDVGALLMTHSLLSSKRVKQAILVSGDSNYLMESELILDGELPKEIPNPGRGHGALAVLMEKGEAGPSLRAPLLAVGGSESRRRAVAKEWLARESSGRSPMVLRIGDSGNVSSGDVNGMTDHPAPLLELITEKLGDSEAFTIIIEYEKAVAGVSVDI